MYVEPTNGIYCTGRCREQRQAQQQLVAGVANVLQQQQRPGVMRVVYQLCEVATRCKFVLGWGRA